jgi:ribonuclease D
LFRLNRIGLPDEVIELLANEQTIKAGAAIHDDVKGLQQLKNFKPAGFVELQQHVKNFGIENNGLKKITAIILNFRISKSQRVTNWENGELTEAQALYAATDAWVCYEIYKELEGE